MTEERRFTDRRSIDAERTAEIAKQGGIEGARDVLLRMGIDPDNGESYRAYLADLAYLRRSREASEKFYAGAKISIVSALLLSMTGGVGWLITFLNTPKH